MGGQSTAYHVRAQLYAKTSKKHWKSDSPVVRHDEHAEEAVDDGERHDQRVETVAQLLPSQGREKVYKENISFWKIFSDSPCKAVDADGVGDEGEAAEHRHGHSLHPEGERLRNEGGTEVITGPGCTTRTFPGCVDME